MNPTPAVQPEKAHEFTNAQRATVQTALAQIREIQGQMAFFLNHVVREAGLPEVPGGYSLSEDGAGLIIATQRPLGTLG